jgi:hypothetical protein
LFLKAHAKNITVEGMLTLILQCIQNNKFKQGKRGKKYLQIKRWTVLATREAEQNKTELKLLGMAFLVAWLSQLLPGLA